MKSIETYLKRIEKKDQIEKVGYLFTKIEYMNITQISELKNIRNIKKK